MIGDIKDYCIICGIRKDQDGKCPNCRTVYATMEELEHEYPEFKSTIPEQYRVYLAKDVRE
jgi:hypothetical protein